MSDERWLERVTETLKARVDRSESFDQGVLDAVRDVRRARPRRRLGAIGIGIGSLAAAAALAGLWLSRAVRLPVTPSSVVFELAAPSARRVALVGDFNDWDQARTPLAREGDRWRATLSLPTGIYRYAFLVDGVRWVADPDKPGADDADFGQPISLLAMK
jgi:hypothetical protein